jgi:hypothetical protein
MGARPQTPGIYRFSASMMHAGRSYQPSLHARICDSAQVHWRWSCPKFLRQAFHEWALHSVAYSKWARDYYDEQRAKGKRRNTVIRSLAFKWIRILFRCWKDHKPYDEAAYERALMARHPKSQSVELQWKKIAGFNKIIASNA